MKSFKLVLVAVSFGLTGVAFAQAPDSNPLFKTMEQACKADADKYCEGKGAPTCLRHNEAKLSQACNDARAKLAASIEASRPGDNPDFMAMAKACKPDSDKYCPGKEGMKLGDCMEDNAPKLSKTCVQAMDKLEAAEAAERGGAPH